jgi:hypothetical protein
VFTRIHFGKSFENLSILANQIRNALGIAIAGCFASAVRHTDFPVGVAQEGEWKIEFQSKSSIFFDGVEAGTDDLDILGFILSDSITESFAFVCSAGSVGFGIKPKNNFLACTITQREILSFVSLHREFGCLFSNGQHA